jgi:hypothetical protein
VLPYLLFPLSHPSTEETEARDGIDGNLFAEGQINAKKKLFIHIIRLNL